MSSSVSIAIVTNSAIAVSKGFGFVVTGSPTLFAETIHSLADVGNQVLLKIGEVRGRGAPDREHPFGRGQEKFFWALVSAVSVFFIGCGINVYHGVHALLGPPAEGDFSLLVLGLLVVALRELGGFRGIRENRHNTTVIAVLFEDSIALVGIVRTLIVAGSGYVFGPHPEFDASIAIVVGLLLGAMAIVLAALNRRLLIDTSDRDIDRAAERWLDSRRIRARVHSLILDDDSVVLFVRTRAHVVDSANVGEALKEHLRHAADKAAKDVYWQFGRPA